MDKLHALDDASIRATIGDRLDVSSQTITNWKQRGVPVERCIQIEKATNGLVRCEDLRPDVEWSVLRTPEPTATPDATQPV